MCFQIYYIEIHSPNLFFKFSMSIILIDKKTTSQRQVKAESQFLSATILKKLASTDLGCHSSQLKIYHYGLDRQYGESQIIKRGEKVQFSRTSKNQGQLKQKSKKGILSPQELEKIMENSKIIVIKSANEDNIRKSKQISLWATTYSNQERLKYFFNNSPHVLLMFATNRSIQIKGIARMQNEPQKIIDKTVWSGVSNIRLGGNFKIKWLRKKPLSLMNVQKQLGSNFKQSIIKSCDGQQLDPNACKKLAYLFEIPQEPYYSTEDKIESSIKKQQDKKKIQNQPILSFPNFNSPFMPHLGINALPPQPLTQKKIQMIKSEPSSQQSSSSRKRKKIKKEKKKKSKKYKKDKKSHKKRPKKQYIGSQDSYDQSSDNSERSSESQQKKKRTKKDKRHKKHKKKHS